MVNIPNVIQTSKESKVAPVPVKSEGFLNGRFFRLIGISDFSDTASFLKHGCYKNYAATFLTELPRLSAVAALCFVTYETFIFKSEIARTQDAVELLLESTRTDIHTINSNMQILYIKMDNYSSLVQNTIFSLILFVAYRTISPKLNVYDKCLSIFEMR